jgi:hypothetical protein
VRAPPARVRETIVDPIVVAVLIGAGLVFGTGVVIGVIVMVAMAVRREDRQSSLTRQPPDVAARGVRRLTGVGRRDITPPDERIRP